MKKFFFIVLIFPFYNYSQTWQWAKKFGGAGGESGMEILSDKTDNIFLTGFFEDVVNFGCATYSTQAIFDPDVLVAKYDSQGNCLWIKQGGSQLPDVGNDIEIDKYGNCYVTGYCSGFATFDTVLINSNFSNRIFFLVKYDSTGKLKWINYHDTNLSPSATYGIAIYSDSLGYSYVTGYYSWNIILGTFSLIANSGNDMFVAKFDPNGNCIWAKSFGNNYYDETTDIDVDNSGNIILTGKFKDTLLLGSNTLISNGDFDGFIVKFDSTCSNVLWVKQVGSIEEDYFSKVKVDNLGCIYTIGDYKDTVIFGLDTLISAGDFDCFVIKFDSNGNIIWLSNMSGPDKNNLIDIEVDSSGLFIAGNYRISTTIDTTNATSNGYGDFFIIKMDTSSSVLWIKSTGAPWEDYVNGIGLNQQSECFATGDYSSSITFDLITLPATNGGTAFYAKLNNSLSDINESDLIQYNISISPNPFSTSATVEIKNSRQLAVGNWQFEMYDVFGREVTQSVILNEVKNLDASHSLSMTVQRGNLPSGIYFYSVRVFNKLSTSTEVLGTGKVIVE